MFFSKLDYMCHKGQAQNGFSESKLADKWARGSKFVEAIAGSCHHINEVRMGRGLKHSSSIRFDKGSEGEPIEQR